MGEFVTREEPGEGQHEVDKLSLMGSPNRADEPGQWARMGALATKKSEFLNPGQRLRKKGKDGSERLGRGPVQSGSFQGLAAAGDGWPLGSAGHTSRGR